MIEEKRDIAQSVSLLQIVKFTMKGFKALSSSLNPEYKAPYKGDNN